MSGSVQSNKKEKIFKQTKYNKNKTGSHFPLAQSPKSTGIGSQDISGKTIWRYW